MVVEEPVSSISKASDAAIVQKHPVSTADAPQDAKPMVLSQHESIEWPPRAAVTAPSQCKIQVQHVFGIANGALEDIGFPRHVEPRLLWAGQLSVGIIRPSFHENFPNVGIRPFCSIYVGELSLVSTKPHPAHE